MFPGHGNAVNSHVPPGSVPSGARPPSSAVSGSGGQPEHITPADDRDFSATPHTRRVERNRGDAHSMSPEEEGMDLDVEPQHNPLVFHRVDGARAETRSPSPAAADIFRASHQNTKSIPDPRGPGAQVTFPTLPTIFFSARIFFGGSVLTSLPPFRTMAVRWGKRKRTRAWTTRSRGCFWDSFASRGLLGAR